MEKINQIIVFIKKHHLAIGVVSVILIGYLVSLIPRPGTRPFISTTPILPDTTPTPFVAENYTQRFSSERYIKVSDQQQIFALNKNKQLIQYLGEEPFPITPAGLPVVDYQTRGGSIIFETGTYADPDNAFYLLNLTNKLQVKLDTNPYKPIIGYNLNPSENRLAFLGKYDAKKNNVNLYLYDLSAHTAISLAQEITANSLYWLNDNYLLVNSKIDGVSGPDFFISLFSVRENVFTIKNVPAQERSTTFDSIKNLLYFVNSSNNMITSFNLSTAVFTDILKLSNLPTDMFLKADGSLVLLTKDDAGLVIRNINPVQKITIKEVSLNLDADQVYIEHFESGVNHFIKIYDQKDKRYIVKYLPL